MKKPIEGFYIALARRFMTASRLEKIAHADKIAAKQQTAAAMNTMKVKSFNFEHEGERFSATLKRPVIERTSVRKLYTLLLNGEILLEDFFDLVAVVEKKAHSFFEDGVLASLKETHQKNLDLVITPL